MGSEWQPEINVCASCMPASAHLKHRVCWPSSLIFCFIKVLVLSSLESPFQCYAIVINCEMHLATSHCGRDMCVRKLHFEWYVSLCVEIRIPAFLISLLKLKNKLKLFYHGDCSISADEENYTGVANKLKLSMQTKMRTSDRMQDRDRGLRFILVF